MAERPAIDSLQTDAVPLPTLHRIAVIGDIHCEDERLETVLRHFSLLKVDATLAVGDIVDGEGDVNRVCEMLSKSSVHVVSGNHDRWFLEGRIRDLPHATPLSALHTTARRWLEKLPKTRSFQTARGPLLLCHGMGDDDMNRIYPDSEGYELEANLVLSQIVNEKKYGFVVNGHTHQPMVRRIRGLTIINAGSLCRHDRPVCSLADFDKGAVQFFEVNPNSIVPAAEVTFDTISSSHTSRT